MLFYKPQILNKKVRHLAASLRPVLGIHFYLPAGQACRLFYRLLTATLRKGFAVAYTRHRKSSIVFQLMNGAIAATA
jgi:hypothetical protein